MRAAHARSEPRNLIRTSSRASVKARANSSRASYILTRAWLHRRILAAGYPHEEQVFFCKWKETLPHRRQVVWVLECLLPNELVPFVCAVKKKN